MAGRAENVGQPATNRCHGAWQSVAVWQPDELALLALLRYPLPRGAAGGVCEVCEVSEPPCGGHAALSGGYAALMSAATPGRVLPSIHSRKAPPAVET